MKCFIHDLINDSLHLLHNDFIIGKDLMSFAGSVRPFDRPSVCDLSVCLFVCCMFVCLLVYMYLYVCPLLYIVHTIIYMVHTWVQNTYMYVFCTQVYS